MKPLLAGGLAGWIATAPMTATVLAGRSRLPPEQRYAIPPYEITTEIAEKAGIGRHLGPSRELAATTLAHFAYGAACGALYMLLPDRWRNPATGAAFGVAVWGGSYLGWLPALRILRPATTHPPGRNAMMLAAHLVWGAALDMLARALSRDRG